MNNVEIGRLNETLNQLETVTNRRDYDWLMNKVDWQSASAEILDKAIGVALAFGDTRQAKQLTQIGLERFPQHEVFTRVWRLFNPPPARVGKPRSQSSIADLDASMKWIQEHAHEYKPGHWLAVKSGQLLAQAPTFNELNQILKTRHIVDSIVHQVISSITFPSRVVNSRKWPDALNKSYIVHQIVSITTPHQIVVSITTSHSLKMRNKVPQLKVNA